MKNLFFSLVLLLVLSACASPSLIKSMGGDAADMFANANNQILSYSPDDSRAKWLAWRSVNEGCEMAQAKNNLQDLGGCEYMSGKIARIYGKVFENSIKMQEKALSFYEKAKYPAGLIAANLEIAAANLALDKKDAACASIKKSYGIYKKEKSVNPDFKVSIYNVDFDNFTQRIESAAKENGCAGKFGL